MLFSDGYRQETIQKNRKGERFSVGVGSDGGEKTREEMEKTMNSMIKKIKEMDDKIIQMEIELEVKCIMIEDMGQATLELQVDIESGEISEEEIKAKDYKKSNMEEQKKEQMEVFHKKKKTVTELAKKKIKLKRPAGIIEEYLIKYRKEMRQKKAQALAELV